MARAASCLRRLNSATSSRIVPSFFTFLRSASFVYLIICLGFVYCQVVLHRYVFGYLDYLFCFFFRIAEEIDVVRILQMTSQAASVPFGIVMVVQGYHAGLVDGAGFIDFSVDLFQGFV